MASEDPGRYGCRMIVVAPRRTAAARSLNWLRDSTTPMFVLNVRRRVTLFNRGCEALSGTTARDVLAQRVDAVTADDPQHREALLAALMPPAEVWQGRPWSLLVQWPHANGSSQPRLVQFWPIGAVDEPLLAVLGIVGEVHDPTPADPPTLAQTLHQELSQLRQELRRRYGDRTLLGRSPAIQRVQEQLRLARASSAAVLVTGPAGTGKQHVAQAIHYASAFSKRLFLPIPLEQTPAAEVKRILKQCAGLTARGGDQLPGTLYLTAIETAGADVQELLLSLLTSDPVVRIITASTSRWETAVNDGKFSAELALRLTPLVINLPSLRDRGEDLLLIAQFLLEEWNRGSEHQVHGFDADVGTAFRRYHWPGEIDELAKVVQEAHAGCPGGLLQTSHLPFRFRAGVEAQKLGPTPSRGRALDRELEAYERELLQQAVDETRGNLTQAAEWLQIPRARLYRRLEQLGLRQVENTPGPLDSPAHSDDRAPLSPADPAAAGS
jgi:DNA-binding NtrC family response regulator